MKTKSFNVTKLLIVALILVIATVLFKLNINANTIYTKSQEIINKMGLFQPNRGPVGALTLSNPYYYGNDLSEQLEPGTNYVNKVNEIRFDLNTQTISDSDDVHYAISYDNGDGTSTYTEDEYPDEIYDPQNPNGKKKLRLKYANSINANNANANDNPYIAQNKDNYSVLYRDNKITIVDKGLIPYVNGALDEPKKWVGVLVDLNLPVESTVHIEGKDDYIIEQEDYEQASRWGAQSDTTFIMWLRPDKVGTFTFTSANDSTKTIDIEIEFIQERIALKEASKSIYLYPNSGYFDVEYSGNTITILDDGLSLWEKNYSGEEHKWVSLLIDLGVDAEIEEGTNVIIEKNANNTSFVMWINPDIAGTYTFANTEYTNDTIDLTIRFDQHKVGLVDAKKIEFHDGYDYEHEIQDNLNYYDVSKSGSTITITDRGVKKDDDGNKFYAVLIDLGAKVQGITDEQYMDGYNHNDFSMTTFLMWITQDDAGTYLYKNVIYPNDMANITIEIEHPEMSLETFEPISVDQANENEIDIVNNYGKYSVDIDDNYVTIHDNGVIPYVGGNMDTPEKWMGFIVDFGVKVVGTGNYQINDIDYSDAARWGATSDTAFVMWINTHKRGEIEFRSIANDSITYTIYIDYDYTHMSVKEVKKITSNGINMNAENSLDKYEVVFDANTNTVKIIDINLEEYASTYKDVNGGKTNEPKKWVGLITDYGVEAIKYNNDNYFLFALDDNDAPDYGATTNSSFLLWLNQDNVGQYRVYNYYYDDDYIDINFEFEKLSANLNTAESIDSSKIRLLDNPGIRLNADKYDVVKENNKITIEDKGLIPYVNAGLSEAKKWVGILVDLNVPVESVVPIAGKEDYTIEQTDRDNAERWGATTDTTFVMWVRPDKVGTFTFTNANDPTDTIDVEIEFVNAPVRLNDAKIINIDGFVEVEDNPGIKQNIGKYNVSYENNKITIEDKGLIPYVNNAMTEEKKWVGILVDLNVRVDSTVAIAGKEDYTIDSGDYTYADRWGAENNTTFVMWLRPDKVGTFTFVSLNDPTKTLDVEIEFVNAPIKLNSAEEIDITNYIEGEDNSGIKQNEDKYAVSYENNKITIEDKNLIPYVNAGLPEAKKWVGILVDLNVPVESTVAIAGKENYTIEQTDRDNAERWGATSDTTFIMWLRPDKVGTFTFINANDPTDTLDVEIEFTRNAIELVSADSIDMTAANPNNASELNILNNNGRYSVAFDKDNNKVTITENNMIPYIGGNQVVPKNWVGLLLDFGVEVEAVGNYTIEEPDRTQAYRWGAQTDTTFIMWLTTDKGGTYTFRDKEYTNETVTIEIEFVHDYISFNGATSINGNNALPTENEYISANHGRYTVTYNDNTITLNDVSMIPYADHGDDTPKKWMGILVDLGVVVEVADPDATYSIDYESAAHWGAENETTFVMWIAPDQAGTYTFKNRNYPEDTITLNIETSHELLSVESITKIDASDDSIAQDIKDNVNKYDVTYNNNTVTINHDGLIPYERDGVLNKWVGFLVDFGTRVEGINGYEITEQDYTDASLYGAASNTAFVMWLNVDQAGTYTFKNSFYSEDVISINVEFIEPELNCNLNPYDDRCPDLDAPLEDRIVLGENEQLITSLFDVEVDLENQQLIVRLKDGVDYEPGTYKVYAWPSDNRSGVKSKAFTLLDRYYNFDMAEEAVLVEGTGDSINLDNEWTVELLNVENIDLSLIQLESAITRINDEDVNYIDYFVITDRSYNESTGKYKLTIKPNTSYDGPEVHVGTYELCFSYDNPSYSSIFGILLRTTRLTINAATGVFTDVSSTSHRLTSSAVYYEIVNYNTDTEVVTFRLQEDINNNTVSTMSKSNFASSYSGVDLDSLTLDTNGDILYQFNENMKIKSKTTQDGIEYINYYDSYNNLQSMPASELTGTLDTKYLFADNKIYLKVNGKLHNYNNYNQTIRYAGGGKFEFVVDYGLLSYSQASNIQEFKLEHVVNDNYDSNEAFTIYHRKYRKSGRYWYVENVSVDEEAANLFTVSSTVDRNNNHIIFTIVYDGDDIRYMGAYRLTYVTRTNVTYTKNFTIEDAPVDFYLGSTYDRHIGQVDVLPAGALPQGNKQYEYYLSLRMVKGEIDPNYQYNPENIDVKIYKKRANLDASNNLYLYDQVDYVVKILNYNSSTNEITYKLSSNVDKKEEERTYSDEITEVLNGHSNFETLYTTAYSLLDKYVFDINGDIDTTTDNYNKSIIKKTNQNSVDQLVYRDNNNEVSVAANQYVNEGGDLNTLLTTYWYLDFDTNGDIIVGNIKGSYETQRYTDNVENYDVTDLFNIEVSQNTSNIDQAITILPKTEVPGGVYYTYVYYNAALYGVGYLNNTIDQGGSIANDDEVVIRPEKYPGLWNKNIHMTTITYLDPVYSLSIQEYEYKNLLDGEDLLYYNVPSKLIYKIKPKDIFKYQDIVHKLQIRDGSNWNDVDSSKYSYILATMNNQGEYEEIEDMSNYSGTYYAIFTTSDDMEPGDYRFALEYTNNELGISATPQYQNAIDLNNKYYGFTINDETDELVVAHNDSVEKTIVLNGEGISNPDDVNIIIYFDSNALQSDSEGNYSYTIGNETKVYFNTSKSYEVDETDSNKIKYTFKITNVSDVTQIGNYEIRFSYSEGASIACSLPVTYTIGPDQYIIQLNNISPIVENSEMKFTMDLTTKYIDEDNVNLTDIDVRLLHFKNNNFVDVSSSTVSADNKEVTRIELDSLTCESGICTGKLTFYLNNKINYTDIYKIEASYLGVPTDVNLDAFEDIYAWDFVEKSVTSLYTHEVDGEMVSEEVEGIYKNLSDQKIVVKLSRDVYKDRINYSINDRCVSDSGYECSITDEYNSDFTSSYTMDDYQILTLRPRNTLTNGKHALILYYDSKNYKVIDFEVHSEYIQINIDPNAEYGEATIKSTLGNEELDGLYTNLNGTITLPMDVTGIDYNRIERYVVNSMNQRITAFDINDSDDFSRTHIAKVYYKSSAPVPAGQYIFVSEYALSEGDTIKFEYPFEVQDYYFDFSISSNIAIYPDSGRDKFVYNNKSGKIVYTITASNLDNLNNRLEAFRYNSVMLDANENDASEYFTFNYKAHDDMYVSNKFDIEVSFTGNTVPIGSYKFKTYYTYPNSNSTITREAEWIQVDESNKDFRVGGVDIQTTTGDNQVHNDVGGSYVVSYTTNVENPKDKINVSIKLGEEDKTSSFVITKTDSNVTVSVLENSNITPGNYTVVITFEEDDFEIPISLSGAFNVNVQLSSNVFIVNDSTIYINSVNLSNFTRSGSSYVFNTSYFINNLDNLKQGYRIYDKNNNDITNTNYKIGTGYKIANPDDRTYTIILIGDTNQDGAISLSDVSRLFNHFAGKVRITDPNVLLAGEIRKKGVITLSDVSKLFNFFKGTIGSL